MPTFTVTHLQQCFYLCVPLFLQLGMRKKEREGEREAEGERERGCDLRLFSLVTLEAKRNQRTQWKVRKRETWLKLGKMERNLTSG